VGDRRGSINENGRSANGLRFGHKIKRMGKTNSRPTSSDGRNSLRQ
jgi:hypothetical protein